MLTGSVGCLKENLDRSETVNHYSSSVIVSLTVKTLDQYVDVDAETSHIDLSWFSSLTSTTLSQEVPRISLSVSDA